MKKTFCRAPLRISYAGGGTDLDPFLSKHGGLVINGTINQFAYCSVEPWHNWTFITSDLDSQSQYWNEPQEYQDVPAKILVNSFIFLKKEFQLPCVPFRLLTSSDVSPGSGLGSSSALTVCVLSALTKFFSINLPQKKLSEYAFHVERSLCGLPGGKQDQYASVFGGIRKYQFDTQDTKVQKVELDEGFYRTLGMNTILYDAGGSRPNANTIFTLEDNVIEKNIDMIKKYKSSENQTIKLRSNCELMYEAMMSGDLKKMSYIFNENWQIKKLISPTITTEFLEEVYKAALESGAMGGKICGAGGGGHVIFLTDLDNRARLISRLNRMAGRVVPFVFHSKGVETWQS